VKPNHLFDILDESNWVFAVNWKLLEFYYHNLLTAGIFSFGLCIRDDLQPGSLRARGVDHRAYVSHNANNATDL